MKKRVKKIIILFLTALTALFVLAGCSFGESKEDLKEKYDLSACVTYYANAELASFTPGSTIREKNVYYPEGVQPYDFDVNTDSPKIKCDEFIFEGWYEVALDAEGKPITIEEFKDATGKVSHYTYQLGEKVDFSKITLQKDDHIYVAANWVADTCVNVKLVHDGDKSLQIPLNVEAETNVLSPVYQKQSVVYGDVIKKVNYSASTGEISTISGNPLYVQDNAFTFVNYYEDEACTTLVSWPLVQQEEDQVIYAKYIEGAWDIVSTANDVKDMFGSTGRTKHYWIVNDIDCTDVKVAAKVTFACEIQGNGYTISNLTVEKPQNNVTTSMFGQMQETAKIENLSLTGLKLEFTFKPGTYNVYFVFTELLEGATITNVTLQGNMNIYNSSSTTFINLGGGARTNCLFGGYTTDEQYLTENANGFKFTEDPVITTDL